MNPLEPWTNHQFDPFQPHPELEDVDISHLNDVDWNNESDPFGIFSSKGVAPPKALRPAEVQRQAEERTDRLFASFHRLKDILGRHEATIQKRWAKKTRTQRLAMLQAAWSDMPATHRPDFVGFRKDAHRMVPLPAKLRNAYI